MFLVCYSSLFDHCIFYLKINYSTRLVGISRERSSRDYSVEDDDFERERLKRRKEREERRKREREELEWVLILNYCYYVKKYIEIGSFNIFNVSKV